MKNKAIKIKEKLASTLLFNLLKFWLIKIDLYFSSLLNTKKKNFFESFNLDSKAINE